MFHDDCLNVGRRSLALCNGAIRKSEAGALFEGVAVFSSWRKIRQQREMAAASLRVSGPLSRAWTCSPESSSPAACISINTCNRRLSICGARCNVLFARLPSFVGCGLLRLRFASAWALLATAPLPPHRNKHQ